MIRVESTDLFGERVVTEFRKTPAPKGYAATPGSGPQSETCKSCEHSVGTGRCGGRTYWKCELLRPFWTGGAGSDILLRSPACKHWQAERVDGAKEA
ncbi:hypothetical protein LMG16407_03192 [Pandoraea apista]|nr:hypothetical protein LMG16407_03192 [Pandoraea apista]